MISDISLVSCDTAGISELAWSKAAEDGIARSFIVHLSGNDIGYITVTDRTLIWINITMQGMGLGTLVLEYLYSIGITRIFSPSSVIKHIMEDKLGYCYHTILDETVYVFKEDCE